MLAQVHRAKNTVENKAEELSSGCIQTFFNLFFLFLKIRPVSSRWMLKQGISMVYKACNLFLFACFLLLSKYLRGTSVCVSPVEVFLWSCSPTPTSLINVLENGHGLCCSRPSLILLWWQRFQRWRAYLCRSCMDSRFFFRITSGSPKMRCRDGGRWNQLAFPFHQQINEIKFKKDTIVFSLSVFW